MLTRDEMETRRLQGAELLRAGWTQRRTARKLGVSGASVWRWTHKLQQGETLRKRRAPGRPTRLTAEQQQAMSDLYCTRPLWSCFTFADAIFQRFGVHYQHDHAGRMLRKLREQSRPAEAVSKGGAA